MSTKSELNELLEIQSKAYKEATQMLFESLNNRVDELVKTVIELQHSLEFSQAELKETNDNLTKSCNELKDCKAKLKEYEVKIEKLEVKVDSLEDYSRRNNVRIDGIEEPPNETSEILHVKVKKIFEEKLQLKNVNIDTIHRLSANRSQPAAPRTIITKLSNYRTRDDIMRNKSKLKGTGIYLNEDLSDNTNKIRKEKMEEYKKARSLGKIAYFKGRNLVIKERKTRVDTRNEGRNSSPPRAVSELVTVFTPNAQESGEDQQNTNLNHNENSVRSRLRSNKS